jgi:purine-binding chemotaxis protein CheW
MNESYLIFTLCGELYGLRVSKIIEVIEPSEITPVPEVPLYIRGITNFRGNILPLVDMRRKFNLAEIENIEHSVVIAMEVEVKNKLITVGAMVDSVQNVVEVDFLEINQIPELGTKFNPEFIEGIITRSEKYIVLLKIDKIMATDEMTILNEEGFLNLQKL